MRFSSSSANLSDYLNKDTSAAPLAVFRIGFGLLMLVSLIRFWSNGWIEKFYLEPNFHFSYWGFEWVKPIGNSTYGVFIVALLASVAITLGYRYRWAMLMFFLSFTYIELMDKTTYLNHYYFVSTLSFLLLFLPASAAFSIDARKRGHEQLIPQWSIDSIKVLLTIVYFYAGLAKLNSDWLLAAEPLKTWLPTRYDLPLIGWVLDERWAPHLFSWAGAAYDLLIPFLLWYPRTRSLAFFAVIGFHLMTGLLFPIGMFPYIMIVSTLIFCSSKFHENLITSVRSLLSKLFKKKPSHRSHSGTALHSVITPRFIKPFLLIFFVFHLIFPFRYLYYPGELFWTEQGYRYSWRVMLMEKAGYAHFKIVDRQSNKRFYVDNSDFLTAFQEKEMAKQPDFIIEYAHYLADHFRKDGWDPAVYVDSYVALNGRSSQPFIDPNVDLTQIEDSWQHKDWILPFNDEIHGL